ncbi:MAG: hypothetical protein WCJ33_05890 [Pseudomonadota bacterium]
MKAKTIAADILKRHFEVGSLLWDEAIECSIITIDYLSLLNCHEDLKELIKELKVEIEIIKNRDVHKKTEFKQQEKIDLFSQLGNYFKL